MDYNESNVTQTDGVIVYVKDFISIDKQNYIEIEVKTSEDYCITEWYKGFILK